MLLTSSVGLLYYIVINTVFAEKILPGVSFAGQQLNFEDQSELNQFITSLSDNSPQFLDVNFDNINFKVPLKELNINISQHEIENYGKGPDLSKVLTEGLALLGGKEINLDITFDPMAIIRYFPFKTEQSDTAATFDGLTLKNCENDSYNLSFNEYPLYGYAKLSILYNTPLVVSLDEILTDPSQHDIIRGCLEYKSQLAKLFLRIPDEIEALNIQDGLVFQKVSSNYAFRIENNDLITQSLNSIKSKTDQDVVEGKYITKGDKAYVYEQYKNGKSLDITTSLSNLDTWLTNQDIDILSYIEKKASILNSSYTIIDVSKLLAQGKTRIDIIRDGKFNWGMLNAEYGLKAIDNYVVEPKQEFSFIRDSGAERHAYYIGGGICNATTTMFRTALEAGFQITERSQHYFNVASYAWGYPENVVDAAFMSDNPRLDLKFVNDLDYPVLLKLEITRDNNNFQYHTVNVYTSPNVPERKVELFDFKRWNIRGSKVFDGSFSRKVYQAGSLIREDTYVSRYR